ncbi:hypothetical protein NC653_029729 [Populus alba x Populus x berolinensis]|uniref:Uncharacterized protein n=1 Tax=Populus alba x Populus x berolinensis TaxID=444605 RepID=A0AAD6Q5J6_9ROSI|nr:hypothetical protein NC653_029729 [Populus alba x Populus x berolinensis]
MAYPRDKAIDSCETGFRRPFSQHLDYVSKEEFVGIITFVCPIPINVYAPFIVWFGDCWTDSIRLWEDQMLEQVNLKPEWISMMFSKS